MRIWWVNHKQTWKEEFEGGYIWAPKRKNDGSASRFYDNLKEVRPGDIVLSYAFACLQGVGVAKSFALDAPKPKGFNVFNWNESGWIVHVDFQKYATPLRMKQFCVANYHLFPKKYSPMNPKGVGNQGCYLAEISFKLYSEIEKLVQAPFKWETRDGDGKYVVSQDLDDYIEDYFFEQKERWENALIVDLKNSNLGETEVEQVIKARKGQGKFRQNVLKIEKHCRVTCVDKPHFLIASHIVPWRHADNEERLASGNGLMLTPTIDLMFDRGFVSFDDNGDFLLSKALDSDVINKLKLSPINTGRFNTDQRYFLSRHRKDIFLT